MSFLTTNLGEMCLSNEEHISPRLVETSPIIDSGKIFNQFQGFLHKLSVCRLAKITSMRLNYL